jgi:hypothetical protein
LGPERSRFSKRSAHPARSPAPRVSWDTIVTLDRNFFGEVRTSNVWGQISAVRENRVFLSPKLPTGEHPARMRIKPRTDCAAKLPTRFLRNGGSLCQPMFKQKCYVVHWLRCPA